MMTCLMVVCLLVGLKVSRVFSLQPSHWEETTVVCRRWDNKLYNYKIYNNVKYNLFVGVGIINYITIKYIKMWSVTLGTLFVSRAQESSSSTNTVRSCADAFEGSLTKLCERFKWESLLLPQQKAVDFRPHFCERQRAVSCFNQTIKNV